MTEAAVEWSSRVLNNQLLLEQSSTRGLLSRFDTYPDRNAAGTISNAIQFASAGGISHVFVERLQYHWSVSMRENSQYAFISVG
ncbi:hypothetical protein [Haloarcula sp. Atlit-7R]|uniref:hypothetical protein n=1 Tax=Haloarcula sp. Atlit-7R TaxID=2282125 RepID=UPI0011C464F7|nr:hypothetical protein [Haloarcula sp. Atlit-7R]